MQHSDDESREAAVVSWYLDESGTDDPSPTAVVGGLLVNKYHFGSFQGAWNPILKKHGIEPPLHMKDFRRPNGRLADVSNHQRKALFEEIVPLINTHKVYSMAATLTTAKYDQYFSKTFKKESMGVYGSCFILFTLMNHLLAQQNKRDDRIPFLMDTGNPYKHHVVEAHEAMVELQKAEFFNLGSLTFDDDEQIQALQAADVVAWASRQSTIGPFTNGYEPLSGLFDEAHVQEPYPEKALEELAAKLQAMGAKL
ncbi:MAG: DUF3800 domain-containing protein [Acidobacteriia bacterium]|nr:DUF3800 domain-containing protein [Terriglobia bacterium]